MRVPTKVIDAFLNGKACKAGNDQSTGIDLYYHGNKIAEWREDGLYISNGGYGGNHGETGSVTTMDRLRSLNRVMIREPGTIARAIQMYVKRN